MSKKETINVQQGKTYIVKEKKFGYSGYKYIKYLIEEVTQFTVLIRNLDRGSSGLYLGSDKERLSTIDFYAKYEVMEEILPATNDVLKKYQQGDV